MDLEFDMTGLPGLFEDPTTVRSGRTAEFQRSGVFVPHMHTDAGVNQLHREEIGAIRQP